MAPGVTEQKVEITTVLTDSRVDWGQKALEALYEVEREEPHTSLPPESARVLVRTAVQPISFQKVGEMKRFADGRTESVAVPGPLITWTPPNTTVVRRFSESDPLLRIDRLDVTSERIRNYLAYSAECPVPIVTIVETKEYFRPVRIECDPSRYIPNTPGAMPSDADRQAWQDGLSRGFSRAVELLDRFPPEDPRARAISLLGEAIWTADPEERFFYAWRALEVIATYDLASVRKEVLAGQPDAAAPYFRRKAVAMVNEQSVALDPLEKVVMTVLRCVPDASADRIEEYYGMRNAIAHGSVSTELHLEIVKTSGEISGVAHRLVESFISSD
jgi:hypothetical protein